MQKKVIISACILGELCRYDGKTKKVEGIIDTFRDYEIIPFCPEAPLFGTPRERISVVKVDGYYKIMTDETKRDVTKLLEGAIADFIQIHPEVDAIVLKSKSPSYGYMSTPIVNEKNELVKYGNGIAAEMFLKGYKNIRIQDEHL